MQDTEQCQIDSSNASLAVVQAIYETERTGSAVDVPQPAAL